MPALDGLYDLLDAALGAADEKREGSPSCPGGRHHGLNRGQRLIQGIRANFQRDHPETRRSGKSWLNTSGRQLETN